MKRFILVLIAAMAMGTGCATIKAEKIVDEVCEADPTAEVCITGLPAATRFFAVYGDYIRVKGAAAIYAEAPSTPQRHREIIADVVMDADAVVADVRQGQRDGSADANTYLTASRMVRAAIVRLNAQLAAGAAAGALQ